jgi:hypothetical protein
VCRECREYAEELVRGLYSLLLIKELADSPELPVHVGPSLFDVAEHGRVGADERVLGKAAGAGKDTCILLRMYLLFFQPTRICHQKL